MPDPTPAAAPAPAPAATPAAPAPAGAVPPVAAAPATPPAATTPPAAAAAPEAGKETPKPAVEVKKEDLKLPEGSLLDPKTVDEVVAFSKEKQLSKEAAQAILERESKLLSSHVEGEKAKVVEAQNAWAEAAKTDKLIGGEKFPERIEKAHRLFKAFGDEELQKFLDTSKLGNHAAVLRFAYRIASRLSEDQFVMPDGGASGSPKDHATALYGKTTP